VLSGVTAGFPSELFPVVGMLVDPLTLTRTPHTSYVQTTQLDTFLSAEVVASTIHTSRRGTLPHVQGQV